MNKYLLIIFFLTPIIFLAQKKLLDTLLLDKMIVANIEAKTIVGTKINTNCTLDEPQYYISPHSEAPKLAYVTDYILCNNGNSEMFFEVYDGKKFVFVKDSQVFFNENSDRDSIKVLLSRRTENEKTFVHSNIQKIVDFGKNYFLEQKEQEISNERRNAMQPFLAVEKYGIGFIKFNAVEGYLSTGANFEIFNPSKKTIKYIWFTFAGENAVEDLVKTPNGKYYTTVKGIGPIESYGIGQWTFEYVWFTDIVEYLRVSTIKIQYMDGSVKTVKYNKDMYIGEDAYIQLEKVLEKQDKNNVEKQKNELYIDANKVYSDVDQEAEFIGGISSFRMKITESFDISLITEKENPLSTEISFIIEKDGSITDIKATGNNLALNKEIERIVKSIKTKWKPAKIGNEIVRSLFRLPFKYTPSQ